MKRLWTRLRHRFMRRPPSLWKPLMMSKQTSDRLLALHIYTTTNPGILR